MAKTKAIKIKRSPGDQLVQIVIYIFVGAFALITLLPFVYIVAGSFATERELTERAFFLFPRTISMNAYQYIFKTGDAIKGLKNSIFVTVVGVLINMVFSSTLAYPLSRPYFKGRKFFTNMVIVTMLFSGGMVPAYLVVANVLHLKDSFWALWLPGAVNPFNMIIIKNYFQGLPTELEEAAYIDGAGFFRTFVQVMMPCAKGGLASAAVLTFLESWNEFTFALLLTSSTDNRTLPLCLIYFTSQFSFNYTAMFAAITIAVLPSIIVFAIFQEQVNASLTAGSVKG